MLGSIVRAYLPLFALSTAKNWSTRFITSSILIVATSHNQTAIFNKLGVPFYSIWELSWWINDLQSLIKRLCLPSNIEPYCTSKWPVRKGKQKPRRSGDWENMSRKEYLWWMHNHMAWIIQDINCCMNGNKVVLWDTTICNADLMPVYSNFFSTRATLYLVPIL